MAKNDFKVTPAESYPLGHAKENKDASAYTGFTYPTGGGDDIGVYKQPMMNPNQTGDIHEQGNITNELNIAVANIRKGNFAPVDRNGQQDMRGYGAATKGRKISNKQG